MEERVERGDWKNCEIMGKLNNNSLQKGKTKPLYSTIEGRAEWSERSERNEVWPLTLTKISFKNSSRRLGNIKGIIVSFFVREVKWGELRGIEIRLSLRSPLSRSVPHFVQAITYNLYSVFSLRGINLFFNFSSFSLYLFSSDSLGVLKGRYIKKSNFFKLIYYIMQS